MGKSIKEQILGFVDAQHEDVVVPEWGDMTVRVRGLTGQERDAFEDSMTKVKANGKGVSINSANFRARFLVLAIVDDEGNRVFTDGEAPFLGTKSAAAINRLYDVAARLSGMSEADEAELTAAFTNGQSDAATSA